MAVAEPSPITGKPVIAQPVGQFGIGCEQRDHRNQEFVKGWVSLLLALVVAFRADCG